MITIRTATADDIPTLRDLILTHGPNPWNHIPRDGVEAHLDDIATRSVYAVVAVDDDELVGAATYLVGRPYARYESPQEMRPHGSIVEVVVHRDHTGRGLGTRLLEAAKSELHSLGVSTVYIKRHEENGASGGMMRKAGFQLVEVFDDPIRTTGSRRTAIERFRFER